MAGTSLAVSVSETPSTSSSAVPPASGITGLSLGTVTWALVGITVLVLGFVAASLSGRRDPDAMHPSLAHAGAGHSFQPSTHEAQGEPTAAAVIV